MESREPKRRFPPPWRIEEDIESFVIYDANGVRLATVGYRNDVHEWKWTHGYLTPDEARRIAKGIVRLPEFLMQRHGFYSRGAGNYRWSPKRLYLGSLQGAMDERRGLLLSEATSELAANEDSAEL